MSKVLILFSSFFLFILAACGTANQPEQATQNDDNNAVAADQTAVADTQALLEKLDMTTSVQANGETVTFTMNLKNTSEEDVRLSFSSGQQYEILVMNEDGEEVYRYSDGKSFTEALVTKEIGPGQSEEWVEEWDDVEQPVDEVSYKAVVTLLPAQINEQAIDENPFSQTISFQIGNSDQTTLLEGQGNHFQNVEVSGEGGQYTVSGKVSPAIDHFYYNVEDGHNILVGETEVDVSGDSWSAFSFDLNIPSNQLPENGTITLVLYEKNIEDGSSVFSNYVPLEQFK